MKTKTVKLRDTGQRNETTATVLHSEQLTKKERNRINVRRWRKNNPDKYKQHLKYVKQWKQDNKEKVSEHNKIWYQNNGVEYYRKYYQNNREKILEGRRKRKRLEKELVNKSTKNDTKSIKGVRKNA